MHCAQQMRRIDKLLFPLIHFSSVSVLGNSPHVRFARPNLASISLRGGLLGDGVLGATPPHFAGQ